MTDLVLKNKKILNNELIRFNYNNEVFSNEITDLIYKFKYEDIKVTIGINDKKNLNNYMTKNNGNNDKYIAINKDFIILTEYINKAKENSGIYEIMKISGIDIVKKGINISKDFQLLFIEKIDKNKDNNSDKDNNENDINELIVNKIPKLFDYYLKIIFKKYQTQKEFDSKKKDWWRY